jgi:integrase
LVATFLDHLERERGNSPRTRNARLAAVHSFFRFAALRHPEHAGVIERVLALPPKRFDRRIVSFLSDVEVGALLAAPDRSAFLGRRDGALLLMAVQTGLRVSELAGLCCGDVVLGVGRTCAASARAERSGRRRSPPELSTRSARGSLNGAERPTILYSRPAPDGRSVATAWPPSSIATSKQR